MYHLMPHLLAVVNPFPTVNANGASITTILDIIYAVVGALALLFITIAGFKYITSYGDPQETGKAKNTIIYAAVGLAVALSAAAITNFVAGKL
jgi:hypothetical protein